MGKEGKLDSIRFWGLAILAAVIIVKLAFAALAMAFYIGVAILCAVSLLAIWWIVKNKLKK